MQKVRQINVQRQRLAPQRRFTGKSANAPELAANPALELDYIVAMPRMARYIEVSSQIYGIYLKYVSPDDIHVYSIDECFLDATKYLETYKTTPKAFAKRLIEEIKTRKGIPATAGIGTNLYLAKIALDITAKHTTDGIGYLDEETSKRTLWDHLPLTDFWQIARGTVKRLKKLRINTMRDVAAAPEAVLYKEFGINAELLIDHAHGREPCTIEDIKAYKRKNTSVSSSQILFSDYDYEKTELVVKEMILTGCQELLRRKVVATTVGVFIGYSQDYIPPTGGNLRMSDATASYRTIVEYALKIFRKTTLKNQPIRRVSVDFGSVIPEESAQNSLLFDTEKVEKEKKTERSVLAIKEKFGKNALLRGMDLQKGATTVERNKLIGGHNGE